jgi:hypothetical protein
VLSAALFGLVFGCAGVQKDSSSGGSGGHGGVTPPAIPGLVSIDVTPSTQTVALTQNGNGLTGSANYTAIGHMMDGSTQDITMRVGWSSAFKSLRVQTGAATVTAPGTYTITAASGSVSATAQLVATFSGSFHADGFDPSGDAMLDGSASATTTIAYPLDGAILPPNMSPVQVHIAKPGNQNAARINFSAQNVSVNYYAFCQSGAGTGCYVDLPLSITQLFIATSENQDIQIKARLGGTGAALVESNAISVAWANVPLSGGLYFWTTMTDGAAPGYHRPKDATTGAVAATGTGIERYDFGQDGAMPQIIYTDMGPPPNFNGSPPATADGAQCIGCHAISNDGRTMALTVGGSSSSDFALLDIGTLTLTVLDAAAAGGSTSLTDINYYKQFRKSGIATETTFGPNGDVMVNMYRSQLIMHGTTASLVNDGPILPSWTEYKSDPFWSQDGKLFVFTSFAQPDIGMYNTTGLNGDMKQGGQIVIATADAAGVHDDARVLVPRKAGFTSYYPVINDDSTWVAYDQSTCGTDPDVDPGSYGTGTCDGYDDSSGSLWIVSPDAGSTPIRLDRANGSGAVDNSWPRWSPDSGTFRGQRLYWLAFSSRRPYGLQVNTGAVASSKPQLWFAAVTTGDEFSNDPSHPPVWLPSQNPAQTVPNTVPSGNHVPQWVKVAVIIP